jgi:hypothetical protein
VTSLGFDCWTSSKISSAESHTERRCSKQQQNGGKDRTKHTLQNISREAVVQVKKAVVNPHEKEATSTRCISSGDVRTCIENCYIFHIFHNHLQQWKPMKERASGCSLTLSQRQRIGKSTCLTLYISASLAPRQTQQFRDQNPPKIFKRQQQHSLQVYPNEIPQTDRRKKHMNLLLHLLPAGQNSESNRTDLPKHTTRGINTENHWHNSTMKGQKKKKKNEKMQYIDGQILKV